MHAALDCVSLTHDCIVLNVFARLWNLRSDQKPRPTQTKLSGYKPSYLRCCQKMLVSQVCEFKSSYVSELVVSSVPCVLFESMW